MRWAAPWAVGATITRRVDLGLVRRSPLGCRRLQPDSNPTGPESPESGGLDATGSCSDSADLQRIPETSRLDRTGLVELALQPPPAPTAPPLARPNDLELVLGGRRIDVARGVDGSDLELESSRVQTSEPAGRRARVEVPDELIDPPPL